MHGTKETLEPMAGPRAPRVHSPGLTWLSLVGLLSSRARLRFTRQAYCNRNSEIVTREDSHKINQRNST